MKAEFTRRKIKYNTIQNQSLLTTLFHTDRLGLVRVLYSDTKS